MVEVVIVVHVVILFKIIAIGFAVVIDEIMAAVPINEFVNVVHVLVVAFVVEAVSLELLRWLKLLESCKLLLFFLLLEFL